jgi:CheY-like chemotaxis protein
LINEILDLSKIEARKVELQLSSVALDVLVRETLAQQEALVRDKPVELLTDLPGQIAPFVTDADRLKQIIINLVSNALKFTERGSVTVRVVADPASHIPSRVEVRDTGIGIPGEKLGLIFEAFQQAEAGTARKYGGTGLGLSISQALCQLMGYRIEVTSEVGHGSTFSVVLAPGVGGITAGLAPAVVRTVPAPAPSRAVPAIPRTADLAGKLVLIIDDELDSRTLLTHLIEEFGCQVIAAASGEQGLRMAREFQPDIITVDLLMPRLDGWDVMRAMKADPQLRDIPVVVVSVIASENRGRIFGAVDVLQKPVVREDVLAVLERNLPPGKPSVLVIDDEADARQIMRAHLEEIAGEIREAQNGREALVLLEQHLPDVVLLDLLMPLMDGVSFLNLLRSDKRYQNLPVVVVTAKHLTAAETEQLRQQSQEVLAKTEVFAGKLKILLQQLCARNRSKGIETSPRSAESAVGGVEGGRATS